MLLALPALIGFATLVPFGEVADESAQSLRAEALDSGQLVGHRQGAPPQAGVNADPGMVFAALTPINGNFTATAAALTKAHQRNWTGGAPFMEISPLAIYAPVFYIPAAAGIALGRHLGFSPYHTGICARLANALAYIIVGFAALSVALRARAAMFGVLLAPMSLNLAGSLSQDGLIIATSTLAAACLSRAMHVPAAHRARAAAAAALFCVAWVKPPYLALAPLLLLPLPLPPLGRPDRRAAGGRALLTAAVIIPVLAWFVWTMLAVSAPTYFQPRPTGPLLPGHAAVTHTDPLLQLKVLLAKPTRVLTLPIDTFILNPLWQEMVGVLGWIDLILPNWVYNLWYGLAGLAAAAALLATTPRRPVAQTLAESALLLLAVGAAFLAIYLSQYLVWTTPGATFIEGPQGRYLLPLVPFVALALPALRLPYAPQLRGLITTAIIAGAIMTLGAMPYLLTAAYYVN